MSFSVIHLILWLFAGIGAGAVTGLAGLSAAVVITPVLVSLCEWDSYNAVTVALASDVLASLFSSYTYYKNRNIDLKRGSLVMVTAFFGTVIGSYCGYLFSQSSPDGLGYLSMFTTIFLGIKFLFKPITSGTDTSTTTNAVGVKKTLLVMCLGCGIGWVCGFTGSGGGVLMLTVFTLIMGYNLKIAVGTSTMIMSIVALTGAISHVSMGAELFPLPMIIIVLSCLISAVISAKYANRCEIKKLNHVVGTTLIILGIVTILIKIM